MSKLIDPDAFGKPGEGLHVHLFGIAIFDVIINIIAAVLIAGHFNWNVWYTLAALFIIGEVIHLIVGVKTTVTKLITE